MLNKTFKVQIIFLLKKWNITLARPFKNSWLKNHKSETLLKCEKEEWMNSFFPPSETTTEVLSNETVNPCLIKLLSGLQYLSLAQGGPMCDFEAWALLKQSEQVLYVNEGINQSQNQDPTSTDKHCKTSVVILFHSPFGV